MDYYSVKDVSALLSVNEETVRRWIRDNKLMAERGSGRQGSKIPEEALIKFLEENKGLINSIAAATLGIRPTGISGAMPGIAGLAGLAGIVAGGIVSPLASGALVGLSYLSIIKNKNKDKNTLQFELMEKELELENIAMNLKNEIANKQNELELIENQIKRIKIILKEQLGIDLDE